MLMNKRKRRADGGNIPPMGNTVSPRFMTSNFKLSMQRPNPVLYRASGGNVSAMDMAEGKASSVRKGGLSGSPARRLSIGEEQASRTGANSKDLALGMAGARRKLAKGGRADMGFEEKGERLRKVRERNDILGSPHYSKGGKISRNMKAMYHELHSNTKDSPPLKKLGATKESLYEGEPHRYKRASGGKLWIKDAINPSKKGALHKSLGVPMGKKIPASKIEKAEHSKSPLLRKRAVLAETLKKFHH
jgi:hypothetical protein